MTRRTALITGASGGIGADLAREFAAGGWDLVLVARSADKLQALAADLAPAHGVRATAIAADLSRHEAAPTVFRDAASRGITVDALVNNAGYGSSGPFAENPVEPELGIIELNIRTLTHLTKLFLPGMLARKRGWILNVASTAAFLPGPFMAVYYASKAYVLSFTEALAEELAGTGVSVTALCPGPTVTGFQDTAGLKGLPLMQMPGMITSRAVARAGYRGLLRGKRIVIPGLFNRLLPQLLRISPRWLVARIARGLQERR